MQKHLQSAQANLDSQNYKAAIDQLRAALAIQPELRGAYYQLGFALWQTHQPEDAELAFTHELDFQPPDPYSLYYLGRIKADGGKPDQALSFYEKSLNAGEVLDCRERIGSAYLSLGKVNQAIPFLETSVRVRPEDGSLHYLLARAYKQKGRTVDAKTQFDAAARWKAKFSSDMTSLFDLRDALAKKNEASAVASTKKLASSNDSDILLAAATELGQAGETEEAKAFLNRTLSINPKIAEAHYDLARADVSLNDRAAARPELEKAIALKPGFYEAELLLGTLLVDEGDGDAAIPHLRAAVDTRADNPKVLMMLGLQYYQRGYFADSITVLKKALEAAPDDPDPRYLLIEAYYRNFEYERALALAEETATRFPNEAMSHFHWGAQLNNMGHLPEAKQQLDLALSKDPSLIEARSMLGDVLFKMGKPDESVACFRAALAADPKLMDAQAGLGKALIQMKKYPEAAQAMEAALNIDPNLASLHLYLSQAYRGLGRVDDAKQQAAVFTKLNRERAAARDQERDRTYPK